MSRIVETSRAVAATRSRKVKIEQLSALLAEAAAGDIEPAVSWLSGELPQGRIGVGWRTLADLDVAAAADSTLTVAEVDEAISSVAATSGAGSAARRVALLTDLFSRSTAEERRFLIRLVTGELRQGALEGIMVDAVAAATNLPQASVRRAFMLSGRLPATAISPAMSPSNTSSTAREFRCTAPEPT